MIASSGKDGVLRVVDGDTHKIVYAVPFTTQLNSEVPLTTTPIKVCPGILGGDEWNSAAYSPKLSLIVVPSDDLYCSMNQKDKEPPSIEKANTGEKSYFGGPITHGAFTEGRGRLTGFDAATGKERWRYESPTCSLPESPLRLPISFLPAKWADFLTRSTPNRAKFSCTSIWATAFRAASLLIPRTTFSTSPSLRAMAASSRHETIPEIVGGNPTVTVFALPKEIVQFPASGYFEFAETKCDSALRLGCNWTLSGARVKLARDSGSAAQKLLACTHSIAAKRGWRIRAMLPFAAELARPAFVDSNGRPR